MTQAHHAASPSHSAPSGESKWERYLRFDGAPGFLPAPKFSAVMESTMPAMHTIVLRRGWAIASSRTWAASEIMISDIGMLIGQDKTVLRQELRPRLPAHFGLVVLTTCDKSFGGNQSSLLSAAVLGLALAREQLRYYREVLNLLQDYCSKRSVGDRKLSSIATVRSQLGDTYRRLRLLEEWTAGNIDTAYPTRALTNEIRSLADTLCKLGGGRAFLSGGFREATAMFEILANLYPGHNDA